MADINSTMSDPALYDEVEAVLHAKVGVAGMFLTKDGDDEVHVRGKAVGSKHILPLAAKTYVQVVLPPGYEVLAGKGNVTLSKVGFLIYVCIYNMYNVSDTYEIFNDFECILHLSTLKGDYFSMVMSLFMHRDPLAS